MGVGKVKKLINFEDGGETKVGDMINEGGNGS